VEDPSLSVGEDHQHGLVAAGALVVRVGMSGCEHSHVFSGTTKPCVELVGGMRPDVRKALHDRVFGLTGRDLEGKAIAMGTSGAGRGVGDQLAVLEVPEGT
jgi:hypothetical protein